MPLARQDQVSVVDLMVDLAERPVENLGEEILENALGDLLRRAEALPLSQSFRPLGEESAPRPLAPEEG